MACSQPPPAPHFKGLASGGQGGRAGSPRGLGAQLRAALGSGRGLAALPSHEMHSCSHPQTFTIRRAVCKTQRQPNEKHIVSQRKLEGEERAAPHPAALGRASKPEGWGGSQPVPLSFPSTPYLTPSPCNRVPRPSPSLLGGHLGARCGAPASAREGSRGSETGKGLWKQTDVYTAVGLRHLHMSCAILGKFLDPSKPPPCQHPHAQGLPED